MAHYLHDYRRHWFARFGLPPPNGKHDQLRESHIRRLMRRIQRRIGHDGGRGRDRPEIQVFSRLDIGHKDFFGEQFVNCRPLRSHHQQVRMDFVFFIPPPPFFEGTRAEFDTTLENCWYGRVVLLFRIRVKTDEKNRNGRSVLMDCDCAMIDCLHDPLERNRVEFCRATAVESARIIRAGSNLAQWPSHAHSTRRTRVC